MHVPTGQTITNGEFETLSRQPDFIADDWVQIRGNPEAVQRVATDVQRVRSIDAAKANRKAQRQARKKNRS